MKIYFQSYTLTKPGFLRAHLSFIRITRCFLLLVFMLTVISRMFSQELSPQVQLQLRSLLEETI